MKATMISAAVNAYAEGFEAASEWIERDAPGGESARAWRTRCRANIVNDYERGAQCALCPAGTDGGDFLTFLAEWDRGFDEVMALGSKGAVENGKSAMTDVDRLTAAFDAMTPWARGLMLELAQVDAVFRRQSQRHTFRLARRDERLFLKVAPSIGSLEAAPPGSITRSMIMARDTDFV